MGFCFTEKSDLLAYINKGHIFQNKWSHAKFHEHQLKSSATESLKGVDKQRENLNQQ
jgi:hypothetical protein